MSNKWQIYCNDPSHAGFQEIWSDSSPTVCPVNSSHDVNLDSVFKIATSSITKVETPVKQRYKSRYYTRVSTLFLDSNTINLRLIGIYIKIEQGTAGNIELYDADTFTSLCETTFSNTEYAIVIMPTFQLHSGVNVIDVNVKYNPSAISNKRYEICIDKIFIYEENEL